ncbi:flagellar filament capping protein FliD [Marinobacter sp. ST-43]|uniref:flagellar filament capping protein FliD n=1 Tax=Marinobacter sp. ST-43 TaxID=3050453 RepID=UPI0026DF8265|nr:flagellar filament capping protein FliD [Marinobacter sp. ST-43]
MASITSLGAGSGIFSADLVDQLVNAERQPTEVRLDRKQQETQAKISAFGALRNALESLRSPIEKLSSTDGMKALTASSSNDAVADVTVDASVASRGSYNIEVTQLARAQSLASSEFADRDTTTVGTGTLRISVGGSTTEVVVDGSNNTLQGLADSINEANAGVSAGVVDTGSGFRLVLSSNESGVDNAIQVSVTDDDGNNSDAAGLSQFSFGGGASNLEETVQAKDALLEVNGIAISRPTNRVEGVVDGVVFDVKTVGTTSVNVARDSDAVAGRVQDFVDKFNALRGIIQQASGYNADAGVGGVLSGDSSVRSIQNDLRSSLTAIPSGLENSPVRTLADIGIKTDPSTGRLEFDQAVFKEKLEANPESVTALFAEQDGADGIAAKIEDTIAGFLSSDGLLSTRTEGLNRTLEDIQDQRDRLDLRIEAYQERLVRQFSAADSLIAQLNSTGDYVSQQLASIAPQSTGQA